MISCYFNQLITITSIFKIIIVAKITYSARIMIIFFLIFKKFLISLIILSLIILSLCFVFFSLFFFFFYFKKWPNVYNNWILSYINSSLIIFGFSSLTIVCLIHQSYQFFFNWPYFLHFLFFKLIHIIFRPNNRLIK